MRAFATAAVLPAASDGMTITSRTTLRCGSFDRPKGDQYVFATIHSQLSQRATA
ncbi:hypothetical protein BH11GEM1_BH11GEM1_00640 [soil metagenome]